MTTRADALPTEPSAGFGAGEGDVSGPRKNVFLLLALACALHVLIAGALALTNLPLCDEGFYGIPAHILATEGRLQNPILEHAGVPYLAGIDRIMYWMAPLGVVLQAAFFKLFGFGLLTQRALSVSCALGTLLAWFQTLRRLLPARIAALACVIVSTDFLFCSLSSRGRADMMSLFFGSLALAAYVNLREKNLRWALLAAHSSCAISGLIHPNGGIAALVSLCISMVYFDRNRIGWAELSVAAAPYALFGSAWTAFILTHQPSLWVAQFLGNVRGRMSGFHPLRMMAGELARYLSAFGFDSFRSSRSVRILLPVSYLVATAGCAAVVRRRVRIAGWLLALFAGVQLSMAFTEGSKQGWYLLHLVPLLSALLAMWLVYLWELGTKRARSLAAAHVVILLLSVAGLVNNMYSRPYQRYYQPLVAFLNANVKAPDVVFGSSELYFGLNCRTCLRDDQRLGAYSGKHADFIVIDPVYRERIGLLNGKEPAAWRHVQELLQQDRYKPAFRNGLYDAFRSAAVSGPVGKP